MEKYLLYHMKGTPKFFEKENEVEVHEFCCDSGKKYKANVSAEGHFYEDNIPITSVTNISFYCSKHKK